METSKVNLSMRPISFSKINPDFTRAKCYVMALGKNRNRTYFSKEAVLDAMPTLNYIPVVAHLMYDEENEKYYVGGHDVSITVEGSNVLMQDLTLPFGVVVNDTFDFVDVNESDGTTATYLTADVIIWSGRYPEIMESIYSEDTYWGESMEIIPLVTCKLKEDDKYLDVQKYKYSCLTLLGKDDDPDYHTEPCFPSSKVESYSLNFPEKFAEEFETMKSQLKELAFLFNQDRGEKMEALLNIVKSFGFESEDLDFSITEDMTETELTEKLEAFKLAQSAAEPDPVVNTEPTNDALNFSTTYMQKKELVEEALDSKHVFNTDDDGKFINSTWYWLIDFDDGYVYCKKVFDTNDDYDESNGRFPLTWGDNSVVIGDEFEEMFCAWLTAEEKKTIEDNRAAAEKFAALNDEVVELREFKAQSDLKARNDSINEIKVEFSDLADVEEFSTLIDNCSEMELDAISEKCYAIRGRLNSKPVKFSAEKVGAPKVPASNQDLDGLMEKGPYGGLFKNYKK